MYTHRMFTWQTRARMNAHDTHVCMRMIRTCALKTGAIRGPQEAQVVSWYTSLNRGLRNFDHGGKVLQQQGT